MTEHAKQGMPKPTKPSKKIESMQETKKAEMAEAVKKVSIVNLRAKVMPDAPNNSIVTKKVK